MSKRMEQSVPGYDENKSTLIKAAAAGMAALALAGLSGCSAEAQPTQTPEVTVARPDNLVKFTSEELSAMGNTVRGNVLDIINDRSSAVDEEEAPVSGRLRLRKPATKLGVLMKFCGRGVYRR